MALVANPFCTNGDMERMFGATGVLAFSDHDESGAADTGVVDDCINQATEEITLYAGQRYSRESMANSTLVNRWATVLSVYFLCQRRGNEPPFSVAGEFERIMEALTKIASGIMQLPGVALKADLRPTMSNLKVDRRWRFSTIRVKKVVSSDPPTVLTQDSMTDVPYE